MSGDQALAVSRAALHELLTDAHLAIVEHRHDWAGAVLHALRKLTAPEVAQPQGRARKLMDEISLPVALGMGGDPTGAGAAPQPPAPEPAQAAGGEPRGRSKSVTPNRGRAGGVWTAERDALLRKLWDEGASAAEAFERLNAVPADTAIGSVAAVYNRAHGLKLRRPPEVAAQLMKRAGRMGAERAAQMAAAGVSSLGARPLVWTAERMDLAKQLWEAGESAEAILPRLNALPAVAEISNAHVIRTQASKHRWQRPQAFLEAKRAKYAAAMRERRAAAIVAVATPEPAPPLVETAPEPPRPASVSARAYIPAQTDDKAEVFEAFDGGMTVRDAAADFGLPLSTLSNWHTEWKLARKASGA